MALRIMSAMGGPGTIQNVLDNHDECISQVNIKEKLQENLLNASKLCHMRFGGGIELATDSDNCVFELCFAFEAIFHHGLRSKSKDKLNSALRHVSDFVSGSTSKNNVTFWPCIKELLTWHEQERFSILRSVRTDYGRGRAWLRAALNERSLERHLYSIINSENLTSFYDEWAYILDQEKNAVLLNVAAGLVTIVFAIRVDSEQLDHCSEDMNCKKYQVSQSEPIISSVIVELSSNSNRERIKKNIPTHIISFDNNDESEIKEIDESVITSRSAPPSCLNSPIVTVNKDCLTSSPSTFQPSSSSSSSLLVLSSLSEKSVLMQNINPIISNAEQKIFDNIQSHDESRILTPLNNVENVSGLVPVSPLDQSLDDMLVTLPHYNDGDVTVFTEDAIEATEPLVALDPHIDAENLDIDALRVRILAMREVLDQAREDAVTSRLQLARFQRQHQNYLERHEVQLQALNRENELLRQQLRKYVTAVQMLKRDSDTATVSDDDRSLDYHDEARQYQKKLIQVAEMHAELMEFNARLTMQLSNRDNFVKRLQDELECLRGPLSEDDMSTGPPCLIHIWIPSAFLTGQPSDIHHVYQIYIRIMDIEWNIYRRYAQFYTLYRDLKKHDAIVTTFDFPPKKTIGNKDAKFVEDRRQKLQQWLRRVVGRLAHCSPAFSLRPSKQTLVSLMPFFGDYPNNEAAKFNSTRSNVALSSPQYMGL